MKKYICAILGLMLGPAGLGSAQSPDAVPPQGTIETVSYTHLDVYKRQP